MNEMAKTDKVLSRKEGGVGYVVFNNPARHNAMSLDMWAETGRIMQDFAKDDSLRVVVLTGAGEKAFVSGADISRFGAERSNEEAVAHYNATTEAAIDAYADARIEGLEAALSILAVLVVLALFFTDRIPVTQPKSADPAADPG